MPRTMRSCRNLRHAGIAAGALLAALIALIVLAALTASLTGCEDGGSPDPADLTRQFEVPYGDPPVPEQTCPCLLSFPDDYSSLRAWPLLVALHGFAGDGESFHAFWQDAAQKKPRHMGRHHPGVVVLRFSPGLMGA